MLSQCINDLNHMYYLINLNNGTLYWLQQLDIFNNHMHTLDSEKEVAFAGGGAYLQPWEISLSQNWGLV